MRKEVKTYGKLNLMGMDLPILARLGDGWHLVAHENGPGIATEHSLITISAALRDERCGVPFRAAVQAVEEIEGLEWHTIYEKALEGIAPLAEVANSVSDLRDIQDAAMEKISDSSLLNRPQGRI